MTGRFKEIVSVQKIKDTKTGKVYVGIVDSDFIKVLNELDKENEQLKKRIDRIDIILDDLNGAEYISRDDAIKALNKIDKVVR